MIDPVGPLTRWVRTQEDPVRLRLVCPGTETVRVPRGTLAVQMPSCVRQLPVWAGAELLLAGAVVVVPDQCDCAGSVFTIDDLWTLVSASSLASSLVVEGPGRSASIPPGDPVPGRPVPGGLASGGPVPGDPVSGKEAARFRDRVRNWFRNRRSHEVEPFPVDDLPVPRRFSALATAAVGTRVRPRELSPEDERRRLLAVLGSLAPGPVALPSPPPPSARLEAQGCTACGTCVRACPADALRLISAGPDRTLRHTPASCTDCGLCTALCPTDVLRRTGTHGWPDLTDPEPRDLASITVATCARCGGEAPAPGPGRKALCPVCAFRRSNPFGSSRIKVS